jgi:hypothetical protein
MQPGRLDRFGKAGEPVAADDQHILDAAVGQLNAHPGAYLAPSLVCTQIPKTCLMPSTSTPTAMWAASIAHVIAVFDLDHQSVEIDRYRCGPGVLVARSLGTQSGSCSIERDERAERRERPRRLAPSSPEASRGCPGTAQR